MTEISEEQLQELTNTIADKCEEMGLEPEQVLDGIARSLIAAAITFGTQNLKVEIEYHGSCVVELVDKS